MVLLLEGYIQGGRDRRGPISCTEGSELSAANGTAMVLLAASDRRHPVEPPVLRFLLVYGCGRTRNWGLSRK